MNPPTQWPPRPATIEEMMLQALAMEREAVARYSELADIMETHNNREVAELFQRMAGYEQHHVDHILEDMHWPRNIVTPRYGGIWTAPDGPEAVPLEDMHYLMLPWHALQLALAAEQRAHDFFDGLAREAASDAIRKAALEMRAEEAEHVELVRAWLAKVPQPDSDWAADPDPPRHTD
ncbi:MAG: rubrerythrin [Gammaproteobacteria bacterium]|nr:rubrerythrin [Gammaproteobacteria bacterium]